MSWPDGAGREVLVGDRPEGGPDELIGRIDLWPDDGVSRDQRGFWLDPAFAGRGLMTEAAERVTEFAFVELGWPRIYG